MAKKGSCPHFKKLSSNNPPGGLPPNDKGKGEKAMGYKVTHLTLRIIPEINVNREEFFRGILKTLSLYEYRNKFVNIGGNKQYYSTASYKGIHIKLPFYETMHQVGFVLDLTEKGMAFLTGFAEYFGAALLELLLDKFILTSDVSVVRIDIETDYIPTHLLKKIPPEYLKSNGTLYIGSYKSSFCCRYSKNKATYISTKMRADFISDELISYNDNDFGVLFSDFLENWKPREMTFVDSIVRESFPSSATNTRAEMENNG